MGVNNLGHSITLFIVYDILLILLLYVIGFVKSIVYGMSFIRRDDNLLLIFICTLIIPTLFFIVRGIIIIIKQAKIKTISLYSRILSYISLPMIGLIAFISVLVVFVGYLLAIEGLTIHVKSINS